MTNKKLLLSSLGVLTLSVVTIAGANLIQKAESLVPEPIEASTGVKVTTKTTCTSGGPFCPDRHQECCDSPRCVSDPLKPGTAYCQYFTSDGICNAKYGVEAGMTCGNDCSCTKGSAATAPGGLGSTEEEVSSLVLRPRIVGRFFEDLNEDGLKQPEEKWLRYWQGLQLQRTKDGTVKVACPDIKQRAQSANKKFTCSVSKNSNFRLRFSVDESQYIVTKWMWKHRDEEWKTGLALVKDGDYFYTSTGESDFPIDTQGKKDIVYLRVGLKPVEESPPAGDETLRCHELQLLNMGAPVGRIYPGDQLTIRAYTAAAADQLASVKFSYRALGSEEPQEIGKDTSPEVSAWSVDWVVPDNFQSKVGYLFFATVEDVYGRTCSSWESDARPLCGGCLALASVPSADDPQYPRCHDLQVVREGAFTSIASSSDQLTVKAFMGVTYSPIAEVKFYYHTGASGAANEMFGERAIEGNAYTIKWVVPDNLEGGLYDLWAEPKDEQGRTCVPYVNDDLCGNCQSLLFISDQN